MTLKAAELAKWAVYWFMLLFGEVIWDGLIEDMPVCTIVRIYICLLLFI